MSKWSNSFIAFLLLVAGAQEVFAAGVPENFTFTCKDNQRDRTANFEKSSSAFQIIKRDEEIRVRGKSVDLFGHELFAFVVDSKSCGLERVNPGVFLVTCEAPGTEENLLKNVAVTLENGEKQNLNIRLVARKLYRLGSAHGTDHGDAESFSVSFEFEDPTNGKIYKGDTNAYAPIYGFCGWREE